MSHPVGCGLVCVVVVLVGTRVAGLLLFWFQVFKASAGVGGWAVSWESVQSMMAAWCSGLAPRWWRSRSRIWWLVASMGLVVRSSGVGRGWPVGSAR